MTKKEICENGFERGYCIASWQDLPEIGTEVKPFHVAEFVGTIENISDAEEVFLSLCFESESDSRQYSPFEFTAKELNDIADKKPYDVWDVYEEGIRDGIVKNWESRKDFYKD